MLASSQITFIDYKDPVTALLSSESMVVPCDSMGNPLIPLGSSPLTTRMSIVSNGYEQSGWTFSRTQQGVTSSINSSTGVLSVTDLTLDSGWVEITASKTGYSSLTKKLTISKVYQGESADDEDFSISATPSYYRLSARGVSLEAQTLMLNCALVGIPVDDQNVSWAILEGDGELFTETGVENSVSFTIGPTSDFIIIECTVDGYPPKTLMIEGRKSGEQAAQYLGQHSAPPAYYNEVEPLIAGDYYLDVDSNLPYVYQGNGWVLYDKGIEGWNEAALTMLGDALEDEKTIPEASIVYAWIDNLIANNASITELFSRDISIPDNGVIESNNFNPSDKETPGFRISGNGEAIFNKATIVGDITADTVDSDALKTFNEITGSGSVASNNTPQAWNVKETLTPLLNAYNNQPEAFVPVTGSYNGVAIESAGVSLGNSSLVLYTRSTFSKSYKDSSSDMSQTFNVKNCVGDAYVSGRTYKLTFHVKFTGDWTSWSVIALRNGSRVTLDSGGSHANRNVSVTIQANDTIIFRGGNSAWPIFGYKDLIISNLKISSLGNTQLHGKARGLILNLANSTQVLIPEAGTISGTPWGKGSLTVTGLKVNIASSFTKYILEPIIQAFADKGHTSGKKLASPENNRSTLKINNTTYTVNGLTLGSDRITFDTTVGVVVVYDLANRKTVYDTLTLSEFTATSQVGHIRTKHLQPLTNSLYNLGTSDLRYNQIFATVLDVLNAVTFRSTLIVTGATTIGGALSAPTLNTGDGDFKIGQNLRTTDNVIFNNINATGSEGTRSAGSYVCFSRTSSSTVSGANSYTRASGYVFKFKKSGTYTVIFRLKSDNDSGDLSYARIYVNGAAVGTERSVKNKGASNFSQNITLNAGDVLDIRAHGGPWRASTIIEWCYINQNQEGPIYV